MNHVAYMGKAGHGLIREQSGGTGRWSTASVFVTPLVKSLTLTRVLYFFNIYL